MTLGFSCANVGIGSLDFSKDDLKNKGTISHTHAYIYKDFTFIMLINSQGYLSSCWIWGSASSDYEYYLGCDALYK